MSKHTIVRKLDPQRRLIIPKETLLAAGFDTGDLLHVWGDIDDSGQPCVVLTLYRPGCVFCGDCPTDDSELIILEDPHKPVCRKCITRLLELEETNKED